MGPLVDSIDEIELKIIAKEWRELSLANVRTAQEARVFLAKMRLIKDQLGRLIGDIEGGRKKLGAETVKAMRRRARAGESIMKIASDAGVSYGTAWQAIRGLTHRDVSGDESTDEPEAA
jgi:hypothetical protein